MTEGSDPGRGAVAKLHEAKLERGGMKNRSHTRLTEFSA